jgi:hypothetical protein
MLVNRSLLGLAGILDLNLHDDVLHDDDEEITVYALFDLGRCGLSVSREY